MRNLKKFLALVLAMAMAFSLMLSASAATFDDKHFSDTEEVTQAFKEAVAVLTGLDVIKGDGDGDLKTIRPQSEITRAEAAALVYRIATGDVNDKQVGLYADYSNFVDVKPRSANDDGDWFAGYVGYCQNAGIIKGTSPTTFNPYGKVTGYEVLAMILRAVGYGKNNEFTGSTWQVEVASLAKTKHITDSIGHASYNYTLNMNARREIVAELLFRGSLIPQVKWTPGLGYVEYENGQLDRTSSLAWEVFGLSARSDVYTGAGWGNDKWGHPQLVWKASLNPTSNPARTVATLKPQPKQSFHDLQRECEVADLMEFGAAEAKDYILYVNNGGSNVVTTKYHIVAADTVTKVGGYGRQVEIYTQEYMDEQFPWHNENNYWSTDKGERAPDDTIVMIDTVVAKVITVNPAVLDNAGHVITPARMTVDLYDDTVNNPTRRIISKPSTSKDNWEYGTGDVLSLNGFTEAYKAKDEKSAYQTTTVINNTSGNLILVEGTHVENIQKMTGVQGKQTVVYRNTDQHQVDGKDYFDDLTLKMDKAGQNTNTTYTWYYDQYGYVQAIDDGGKANYGVITAVYAAFVQGESQTTGRAKAIATVRYADGTTGTEEIDYFMANGQATPSAYKKNVGAQMTNSLNTVQLWPQYDIAGLQPMQETDIQNSASFSPALGQFRGIVSMAPVAGSNQYTYLNDAYNKSGILYDNLWKFVKTANDMTVAIEVAGGNDTSDYTQPSANTGDFVGHWNADVDTTSGGKLFKSQAYITKNAGAPGTTANVVAWLDDDSQIIVRNPANNAIVVYDGVSALPGDVVIPANDAAATQYVDEIDWADTDNDGRADVVYVSGTISGLTTYGLFYFGGTSSWDGTTGSMQGWLNGEAYTLTTGSLANYNAITNSAYKGRLFAVQLFNGALQNVMVGENGSSTANRSIELLADNRTAVSGAYTSGISIALDGDGSLVAVETGINDGADNVQLSGTTWDGGVPANSNLFRVGQGGGNPYNAKTEAVYFVDSTSASSTTDVVTFNPNGTTLLGSTVQVWRDNGTGSGTANNNIRDGQEVTTYHLTPNSKVYGIGTGVTSGFEALEYLNRTVNNEVTIVYENEGNTSTGLDHQRSILEIYVVTDNDNTPTVTEGELNYRVAAVSLDSSKAHVTTVTRRIGSTTTASTTAVYFDWQLYTCSSDGSSPVAVAGFNDANVVVTSGAANITVAANGALTRGSYYFVRVSDVTDMSSTYTVDSAIFYVP